MMERWASMMMKSLECCLNSQSLSGLHQLFQARKTQSLNLFRPNMLHLRHHRTRQLQKKTSTTCSQSETQRSHQHRKQEKAHQNNQQKLLPHQNHSKSDTQLKRFQNLKFCALHLHQIRNQRVRCKLSKCKTQIQPKLLRSRIFLMQTKIKDKMSRF